LSHPRIIPILLAGGSGTRLWPVSRDAMPKQFLPLIDHHSTYQQALMRVADAELFATPVVMTAYDFRFFARDQAEELGIEARIVLEPERRDSGPAIAAAAVLARQRDPQAVVLTLAADHVILDTDLLRSTCRAGREAALAISSRLGLSPRSRERATAIFAAVRVSAVAAFVEKPDPATAGVTSPTGIYGTRAISCSVRRSSCPS
jgi:mannose-1-phosphate guanylyltransferase/mannose-6-phosphate isomerase